MPKRKAETQSTPRNKRSKVAFPDTPAEESPAATPIRSSRRKTNVKPDPEPVAVETVAAKKTKKTAKQSPRKPIKQEVVEVAVEEELDESPGRVKVTAKAKVPRKRKTKEEKEAEAMPLASRTIGHRLYIGAHVSSAGGVHNSIINSTHIGGNAFALFLKSQRKWANPPLADDHCTAFHSNCKSHAYDQNRHVVPHGSYLVNLAHTDADRTTQAYGSFLDDLKRCERLGISLYNFHPGNTVGNDRSSAIAHLASNINRAHADTSSVITLLENMAAGGNVLGSTFEDLRDIIALITNKDRVGVCLDTCHAFAYGYDLRTSTAFQQTMSEFDRLVGMKYLKAVHVNDSKAPFASRRDLHANIGTGFLGLRAFHNLVNDVRFVGMPLVLETPIEVRDDTGAAVKDEKGKVKEDKGIWAGEIKMLEGLVGMDTDSEEFVNLEKKLARKGEPERKRLIEQQERKQEKVRVKAEKGSNGSLKKKKAKKEDSEAESSLSDLGEDDE